MSITSWQEKAKIMQMVPILSKRTCTSFVWTLFVMQTSPKNSGHFSMNPSLNRFLSLNFSEKITHEFEEIQFLHTSLLWTINILHNLFIFILHLHVNLDRAQKRNESPYTCRCFWRQLKFLCSLFCHNFAPPNEFENACFDVSDLS